jgi:hypothetical protein
MRHRFDQLGKRIGQEALGLSGPTIAHAEISPDAQHADLQHQPDPARETERARLGLLGRLASVPCLIEVFGRAPDPDEVLACIGKLVAFRRKRVRDARRRKEKPPPAVVDPILWIIAAGRPTAVLAELGVRSSSDWPAGVYLGPGLLRVGVSVASELPRERSTLLVRLMAAGPLLPRAIADLAALPPGASERVVAAQILVDLQHVLGKRAKRTREEQEFIVAMRDVWAEEAEKVRERAREQGRVEEAARNLLTVLRVRGLAVPKAARERILAEKDPSRLERWHERAILAASIAEVLDEPS